jgi:hypothetical protein
LEKFKDIIPVTDDLTSPKNVLKTDKNTNSGGYTTHRGDTQNNQAGSLGILEGPREKSNVQNV